MTDVTTALTLVIPQKFHDEINVIRKESDRAFPRWMPHINFIFPFVPVVQFDDVKKKLQDNLKNFGSFTLELSELGYFPQGKNATFHLKPKDQSKLKELFEIIKMTLPDVEIKHAQFNPHLTLGQCKKTEADKKINEIALKLNLTILSFTVDKISIINRSNDGPFQIHTEISLN